MLDTAAELISTAELAKRLNLTMQTLAQWRLRGFGPPFVKAGSRVMYDAADVAEWIASRKRASTADRGATSDAAATP